MKQLAFGVLVAVVVTGCNKSAPDQVNNPNQSKVAPNSAVSSNENADDRLVADLLAQAEQKYDKEDFAGALQLLELALTKDPKNTRALRLAAGVSQEYYGQLFDKDPSKTPYDMMKKSAGYLRALTKLDNSDKDHTGFDASIYYNEACALAHEGKKLEAIASLTDCLKSGYTAIESLETDEDLDPLREMPEFKSLVPMFKSRLVENRKRHARAVMEETKPFAFNFKLPTIDGKTVSLSDYAGKVLIVDICATWCPPCREEAPYFVALHKKYREKGFEIVGINYEDVPEAKIKETIKKFVDAQGITYPCAIGDVATVKMVPDFQIYPTTLFFDRTGKVRAKVQGSRSFEDLEALVTVLLDEPAAK
jgi:thiol-disulfide isomerase/thioredoxin